MKDSYFIKSYFKLFLVVALQNIIVFGVNLADGIMLGMYSETAMSGVSLANQIQFLLQMLVTGAGNGLVAIASQYWGRKQTEPIKKIFSSAFYIAVFMSIALGAVVLAAPVGVLRIISPETEIVEAGAEYLRIIAFTYVIFAISNIFIALMRSVEIVKIGFYTSVAALFINIGFNWLLIFGKCGFPEMGVRGAALATLISRAAELIFVLFYVFVFKNTLKLKIKDVFVLSRSYFFDYIKTGMPLVLSSSSWGIAMAVQSAIIGRLGPAAIGANAIAAPVFSVVGVLYTSSASAAAVLIGKTVGEGDIPRVKRYTKKLQLIFIITGFVSAVFMAALKYSVIGFYSVSDETRQLALVFMDILIVTVIGSAYEMPCLCGIVAGGGDTKFTFYNDLIFMWLIVLPSACLSAFVFHWPVPVTFFMLKSDQLIKCAVAAVKVNRYKWIKTLTR